MLEIVRLNGLAVVELDFLEREATPEPAMKHCIRPYLIGLSPSETISILDLLGVDRCVDRPFKTGCRTQIYSRSIPQNGITSLLTRP